MLVRCSCWRGNAARGIMNPTWYFDFISPYAYLQWQRLKSLGLAVQPVPILFAAVLDHLGHKGPAEMTAKRRFTYRYVQFEAMRRGVPFRFPDAHPFNPLTALRLAIALDAQSDAVDPIFAQIWGRGGSTEDFADIARGFGIDDVATANAGAEVNATLRTNTETALARGVFGVPTLVIGDELFWGDDAAAMALAYRDDPTPFTHADDARIDALPMALVRKVVG
jgi:2-hydroxychromene-2-carboxylate isomerase